MRISAILLAAGESKRMGVDKLGLPWGNGTVLEQCLKTLLRSEVEEVVVVLGERTRAFGELIPERRVKIVRNTEPRKGMSASIRKGLEGLDPSSTGILVALADQPLLRAKTINALLRAFTPGRGEIVVPTFQGRRGNPVLFDRIYEAELRKLRGDVGGRSVVERHRDKVVEVPTRSESVIRDLDRWDDYVRSLRRVPGKGKAKRRASPWSALFGKGTRKEIP